MPIVITLALISALSRSSGSTGRGSLLEPSALRERVAALPESERRARALEVVGGFEALAEIHVHESAASLEEYVTLARRYDVRADTWIRHAEARDAAFAAMIEQVILTREALLQTLDAEEWRAVFE